MSYRQFVTAPTWHWRPDCSAWPLTEFVELEDRPPAAAGQSICPECSALEHRGDHQPHVASTEGMPVP